MKRTKYALGRHCAYRLTTSPSGTSILVPIAPSAYAVPEPSGSVFHSLNACAASVKRFVDNLADPP